MEVVASDESKNDQSNGEFDQSSCTCRKSYWFPWNFNCKHEEPLDFEQLGFLQIIFFTWLFPVVSKGVRKTLESEDLVKFSRRLQSKINTKSLKYFFESEKEKAKDAKNLSLWKVYWRFSKDKIIAMFVISVLTYFCDFMSMGIVLTRLFDFLEDKEARMEEGFVIIVILGVFLSLRSMGKNVTMLLGARIGCLSKSAFLGLIYEKSLRMKNPGEKTVGELVNLCSNDTSRIAEGSLLLDQILIVIISILSVGGYLGYYFGVTSLAGVGIILLYLPVQASLGKLFAKLRTKSVKWSDKRVKVISEAISSIKLIKMYAWEKPFSSVVYNLRKKEQYAIQKMAFVQAFTFTSGFVITHLAPVVAILAEIYSGRELTMSKAFVCMSMFTMLNFYIIVGPLAVRGCAEAVVSFRRIKQFLLLEEHTTFSSENLDPEYVLELSNGSFSWKTSDQTPPPTEKEDAKEVKKNKANKEVSEEVTTNDDKELEVKVLPDDEHRSLLELQPISNGDGEFKQVPLLHDISINIKKKSLIGICGPIGSGKSSFIQALLNEMDMTHGEISVTDSIAYVPQQPWIINGTVRDNVLLGKPFEEAFFKEVCHVCALDKDIENMTSGDLTEIGERGVNLSGGQKQRLSLARALYAEKDLYLLDDPLSAVDTEVGKHIFDCCIRMAMKNYTVVVVTHQLQYLKDCDYVIYMKDGRFEEQGTYQELMEQNQAFAADINKFHAKNEKSSNEDQQQPPAPSHTLNVPGHFIHNTLSNSSLLASASEIDISTPIFEDVEDTIDPKEEQLKEEGRLIEKEEKEQGSVAMRTYLDFLKHAGGYMLGFFIVCVILSSVIFQILSDYWLSLWLKKDNQIATQTTNTTAEEVLVDRSRTDYYMLRFGLYIAGMSGAAVLSAILCVTYVLRGATRLHNATFKVIFAAPMSFFDTTPLGRLVNRLAKDVDEIDNFLPFLTENLTRNMLRTLAYTVSIGIAVPWMLIAVAVLLLLFGFLVKYFRKIYRSVKRIENVTRSPIFSCVTTSAQGLVSVRAFKKQEMCTEQFHTLIDQNTLPLLIFYAIPRMFGLFVDLLCVVMTITTSCVGVVLKDTMPPSIIALTIVFSLRLVGLSQFCMRLFADFEARCLSLERLNHYMITLNAEGDFKSTGKNEDLVKDWPMDGSISFDHVSLRYRDNLPLVLKDFSIEIKDKEKIGIVGRTGAGKSSIGVALYRLVNPQHGNIKIAGLDTQQIGLTDLRSALTIIPQDPVLFNGTVRYNLDPFDQYSDEDIWNAIEKAHLSDIIGCLPNKLQSIVDEGGSNYSVGERQLVCMARALLRNTKIIMMDEATASVDSRTDSKIQETIQECFADCTVLTVAHRLNTIMHCDKILVMDNGQIAEFDTPEKLLSKQSSQFKSMVSTAKVLTAR